MKRLLKFLILSAAVVPFGSPALADREPTAVERSQIELALRRQNFMGWTRIELNAGQAWKITAARTAQGDECDLTLEPGTLQVLERVEHG